MSLPVAISEDSIDAAPSDDASISSAGGILTRNESTNDMPASNDFFAAPLNINSQRNSSSRTSVDTLANECFSNVTAANLHEYSWPLHSVADSYFIQEQLAEFLDVKSFKRKYPDLTRRPILDIEERAYLLQNNMVTQTQLNMGLTALRAEEVYDLMLNDAPQKFDEYKKVLAERNKQVLAAKQIELQAIKADSKRLEELRKKAMRAASEWNAELNKDRSQDRRFFFDLQTMIIQEPARKRQQIDLTQYGPYPAAVIPGQYQNFFKMYSDGELNRLPANTVIDIDEYVTLKPSRSPPPITVRPEELIQAAVEEKSKKERASTATAKERVSRKPSVSVSTANDGKGDETGESCAFCQEDIYSNDQYVQCSKCGSCGHPLCMDMSDDMYHVLKTYAWMCMECKPCSICSKLDEEDKMLFCDRCDRGYHTFCVGLDDLPTGRWVCPKFCGGSCGARAAAAAVAAVADVIATPSTLKPSAALDETVEAVTAAVLGSSSANSSTESITLQQSIARKGSASSSSSKKSKPGGQCIRCGAPTGRPRRRRLALCTKCTITEFSNEPSDHSMDASTLDSIQETP